MIFLDTNICIYALNNKYPQIVKQLKLLAPEDIKIPSLVKAELLLAAEKSNCPAKTLAVIDQFLFPFEIVPFDDDATVVYAKIRSDLEKKGQTIGPNDMIIAATVLNHKGTLVTHNVKEFARVKQLKIKDWITINKK